MAKLQKQLVIRKKNGLHARPATLFVQLANTFNSSVRVKSNEEVVDGKSIISILSLGVNKGAKISLIAEGEDAKEAIAKLQSFLEDES